MSPKSDAVQYPPPTPPTHYPPTHSSRVLRTTCSPLQVPWGERFPVLFETTDRWCLLSDDRGDSLVTSAESTHPASDL
jgi:hypothetical protein